MERASENTLSCLVLHANWRVSADCCQFQAAFSSGFLCPGRCDNLKSALIYREWAQEQRESHMSTPKITTDVGLWRALQVSKQLSAQLPNRRLGAQPCDLCKRRERVASLHTANPVPTDASSFLCFLLLGLAFFATWGRGSMCACHPSKSFTKSNYF